MKHFGLILSLLFSGIGFAEEVEDFSSLPAAKIEVATKNATGKPYQIGDRIALNAELSSEALRMNSGFGIRIPTSGGKIEEKGWIVDPNPQVFSGMLRFVVAPIRTGELTLPTLIITNREKTPIARTETWSTLVEGPDPTAEGGFLGLLDLSLSTRTIFVIILSAIVTVLFLIFGYRILRSRLRKPAAPPIIATTPVEISAEAEALRAIDRLFSEAPINQARMKMICFGISEVLKRYFSRQFKIEASESTTQEMMDLLRNHGLSKSELDEVLALFDRLDWVKFTSSETVGNIKIAEAQTFRGKAEMLISKWARGGSS